MSKTVRSDCLVHEREFDCYCFYHKVVCCSICHSGISTSCDVIGRMDAKCRLESELTDEKKSMIEVRDEVAGKRNIISCGRREIDNQEEGALNDVTLFYDELRAILVRCEQRDQQPIRAAATDQREKLDRLDKHIANVENAVATLCVSNIGSELGITDDYSANSPHNTHIEEELYKVTQEIQETTAAGKAVLRSLAATETSGNGQSLQCVARSEIIKKVEYLLDIVIDGRGEQEGACAVASNTLPQIGEKDFTEMLKLRDLPGSFSGDVRCMRFINSSILSDLILLTHKPDKLIRLTVEGELKFSKDLPNSTAGIWGFSVTRGIISVPSCVDPYMIRTYATEDLSLVKTIPAWGECPVVDVINDKFVVGYYSPPSLRLLSSDGDIVAKYVPDGTTSWSSIWDMVVSSSEDLVIIMTVIHGVESILIISGDLKSHMKTVGHEKMTDLRGISLHKNSLFVLEYGKYDGTKVTNYGFVMKFDTNGMYRGVVLDKLTKPKRFAYNGHTRYIAVVLHDQDSVELYKGHVY